MSLVENYGPEILRFREGGLWVACWRRFDIIQQGPDEIEAIRRLLRTICAATIVEAAADRLPTLGAVPRLPAALLKEWERRHEVAHRPRLRLVTGPGGDQW